MGEGQQPVYTGLSELHAARTRSREEHIVERANARAKIILIVRSNVLLERRR
jgi:hypothetical protein